MFIVHSNLFRTKQQFIILHQEDATILKYFSKLHMLTSKLTNFTTYVLSTDIFYSCRCSVFKAKNCMQAKSNIFHSCISLCIWNRCGKTTWCSHKLCQPLPCAVEKGHTFWKFRARGAHNLNHAERYWKQRWTQVWIATYDANPCSTSWDLQAPEASAFPPLHFSPFFISSICLFSLNNFLFS